MDLDAAMLYGQLVFQVAFTACVARGLAMGPGRGQDASGRTVTRLMSPPSTQKALPLVQRRNSLARKSRLLQVASTATMILLRTS